MRPQDNETSIYGDKFGDGLLKYATDGEEYTTVHPLLGTGNSCSTAGLEEVELKK